MPTAESHRNAMETGGPILETTDTDDMDVRRTLPLVGCEVTEYDELTGQNVWNDSVFVEEFMDSAFSSNSI